MARRGRQPDFIVVGSMKCGTTSLHHYLSCHPQVQMSRPKELNFFVGAESRAGNDPSWGNWWRGEEWYRGHFSDRGLVRGEVSPAYVGRSWGTEVVQRMHSVVPEARLVLLVREPMARLRSHYMMLRRNLEIAPISFAEFVGDERYADYLAYSHYGSQVACLLERFPVDRILVVESAALDADRELTLGRIFGFLGVDPGFRSPAFGRRLFEGRQRRFPSRAGEVLLRSVPFRFAEKVLPFTLYEMLRNVALGPFTDPEPSLALPAVVERRLRDEFRAEVDIVRRLTGLGLPTLGR